MTEPEVRLGDLLIHRVTLLLDGEPTFTGALIEDCEDWCTVIVDGHDFESFFKKEKGWSVRPGT